MPPWWWKLGWTLEEATPKPKTFPNENALSNRLKSNVAQGVTSAIGENRGRSSGETSPADNPKWIVLKRLR